MRKDLSLTGCVLSILFGTSLPSTAQILTWHPPVDVAPEDAGQLRPRIALNGASEPVVLWALSSTGGCFAALGQSGSFLPPVRLNPEGTDLSAANWQGPAIASHGDTVWAVYKGFPEETAPSYLIGSTDGGLTWGDTLRVDPNDGLISRYPTITVRGNGEPVVQYMQFTTGYEEPRQVVRTRMDGAWMPVAPVSAPFAPGEVCDCCTGELVSADDRVVALYRNAGSNLRVVWGAASTNGGMGFGIGARMDTVDWVLPACPSSGPDAYIASDSVRYVWMSGAENGTKVYLGSAHVDDLQPALRVRVHPGQPTNLQQNFPRIAGHGDTLGVVWEQFVSGAREILFSWSVTGPLGLSGPDTVNVDLSGQQRTPDIAFASGAFHIVWSEVGTGQVRYRKATLSPDVAVPEQSAQPALLLAFDPANDRLRLSGPWTAMRVSDAQGRIILPWTAPNKALDVHALPAGVFIVQARDAAGITASSRFLKP